MNVPSASHMGGVWECQLDTVKLTLADPDLSPKGVHLKPLCVLERPIHKLVFLMTGSQVEEEEPGRIPAKEP